MTEDWDNPRPDSAPPADTHTPGPWRRGRSHWNAIVCDTPVPGIKGSDHVAHYGGHLVAESVAENNQDIIAAAPDLLEALKDCESRLTTEYRSFLHRSGLSAEMSAQEITDAAAVYPPIKNARAAIAKAEGR